jgi:hypothetical protein
LAYTSQHETQAYRLISKGQKIRRKLGGSANIYERFPDKPKGMHWRTYWGLRARALEAEEIGSAQAMKALQRHKG